MADTSSSVTLSATKDSVDDESQDTSTSKPRSTDVSLPQTDYTAGVTSDQLQSHITTSDETDEEAKLKRVNKSSIRRGEEKNNITATDVSQESSIETPEQIWREEGVEQRHGNSHVNDTETDHSRQPRTESTETDSHSNRANSSAERTPPERPEDYEDIEDMVVGLGVEAWQELLYIEMGLDRYGEPHPRDSDEPMHPQEPLYPQGEMVHTECFVCFEKDDLRKRLCCNFPVCDYCLESYLVVQIARANVKIECVNINCNSYIHRSEISARLPPKYKVKFYKFLIDANIDPSVKTCPRCSSGLQIDKSLLRKRKVMKNGLSVRCKRCGLEWCFTCHAPWHQNLTCREYRKGDVLLKDWAKEFHYGQQNAQQCPKCKIFIQRSLGCDHMTCSRCDTSFCYRCGEHYRGFKLLGNHFSRLSPFGCRYNFMPDAPHTRRLIRGAVLGGRVLGGLALSGLVVAAGAFLLGISVVALPAWGGYKLHKRRRYRQRLRANRKYAKQNLALRNLQAKKAAELSVPALPLPGLDSSDSAADDSSEDMRDGVMVGLQLPDAQRVEVLVHQASSQPEEGGTLGEGKEVVTDSVVILSEVQEVENEAGYKMVVANIYAKARDEGGVGDLDASGGACGLTIDEAEGGSLRRRPLKAVSQPTVSKSGGVQCEDESGSPRKAFSETAQCHQPTCHSAVAADEMKAGDNESKKSSIKEPREKHLERAEKCEQKQSEAVPCSEKDLPAEGVEKHGKKPQDKEPAASRKCSDQRDSDQLGKESTNGCFGNIFSKKITVIQLTGKRNLEPQSETQKPSHMFFKASSLEKNQEKMLSQRVKTTDGEDATVKDKPPPPPSPICCTVKGEGGGEVMLQDCVVLSSPGDFASLDTDVDSSSFVSTSSVAGGDALSHLGNCDHGSCLSASTSFRGSNMSCDIVTYL